MEAGNNKSFIFLLSYFHKGLVHDLRSMGRRKVDAFLLTLIFHWLKFATMSNNSPLFLGMHPEKLLCLAISHAQ